MSKVILITGDLASGKSTFSQKLSDKMKTLCINKDNLKELLGDNFGFKNREENLLLSKCTFDIFKYVLEKAILSQTDIIFESNFRNTELEYINNIASKYGLDLITIVFKADINILHKRFINRINNENRHIVHKAVDFSNFDDFKKQIENDRIRNYPGNILIYDTTDFTKLDVNKIYEDITNVLIKN